MKRSIICKILTSVFALQIVLGIISPSAFAAEPGGGTTTKPLINNGATSVDLKVQLNSSVSTSLTANMSLNWKITVPSKGTITLISASGTNATLTYTPAVGDNGKSIYIVIKASDPAGNSSTANFYTI